MPIAPCCRLSGLLLILCLGCHATPDASEASSAPGSLLTPVKPIESPLPSLPKTKELPDPISLGLWIAPDGHVLSIDVLKDSPSWHESAVQAAMKWRFEPVLWKGSSIPTRTILTFAPNSGAVLCQQDSLPNLPDETHAEGEFGLKPAVLKYDPDIQMPFVEKATRGKVEALITYIVEPDGNTSTFEIPAANSEAAYRAVIDQISNQRFTPATIGGQPVRFAYKQVISTICTELPLPEMAGLIEAIEPVYPAEQLIANTPGTAKVTFTLNSKGRVEHAEVVSASAPEFGLALKAAVENWGFTEEAATEQAQRSCDYAFDPEQIPGGLARLVSLAKKGEKISASGAGLDGKPVRVYSAGLSYPPEKLAAKEAGSAKIEFIIDRNGLAQMPRIIECSAPSFGWAAATWIGSMRFKPLHRNGAPTDLRLVIPISFSPPQNGSS